MTIIDTAREIAITAHGGVLNKHDGELYLLHLHRVSIGARKRSSGLAETDIVEAIAWLHDVVEDTTWTLMEIHDLFIERGHNRETTQMIVDAVALLTKPGDGSLTNEDYYRRIRLNPFARIVKQADMQDNFSRNHKIEDDEKRLRMAAKYSLGMDILG